ncbi:MAG: hypothetical protein BRD57_00010, partial [Proteobacteria bacterium SW_6_67_9]
MVPSMPDDLDQTIRVTVDVSPEAGPSEASLVVIYGSDLGRRYPLDRAALELGRDDTNPIQIPSEKASRRHARVVEHDGQAWIEDLGSTNGTLVNDQQITRAPLAHGDIINIGSVLLKYICGGDAEALYHEELYQLTITDNLTGLRNQRYLFDFLDAEVARASRHGRPLALVLFDIDEFKSINDGRGHLAALPERGGRDHLCYHGGEGWHGPDRYQRDRGDTLAQWYRRPLADGRNERRG